MEPLRYRYNLIVGVFRNQDTAEDVCAGARAEGYDPFYIRFENGAMAVCLASSSSLVELSKTVASARSKAVCPRDAWIYRRK